MASIGNLRCLVMLILSGSNGFSIQYDLYYWPIYLVTIFCCHETNGLGEVHLRLVDPPEWGKVEKE
jgi:hypothetical protein